MELVEKETPYDDHRFARLSVRSTDLLRAEIGDRIAADSVALKDGDVLVQNRRRRGKSSEKIFFLNFDKNCASFRYCVFCLVSKSWYDWVNISCLFF